ncbi:MAG: DUF362 domain-containing protein [Paramuribaculum sp.]|nr:DUF362 domain-containing protein [Paramuribaculum sp.]
MKKLFLLPLLALGFTACSSTGAKVDSATADNTVDSLTSVVYHIKDITPENLIKVYEALGKEAKGEKVAVKISTGESNKSNHLDTALIKDFVHKINGIFVECNTAYAGNRNTTEAHLQAAKDHGFMDIAQVDIMDAEGDTTITIEGGYHLPYDIVGKNFMNYDFLVVLSHFKGHQMGGFGGALKNISIGIGSSDGKAFIHSAGKTDKADEIWQNVAEQDDFLESMADASKAIIEHMGDNILYINVANRLSVDCDCNGKPAEPKMGDLGIYASLDPVALDKACVDAVFNSDDPGKEDLIERINSRHGTHLLDAAEKLGLGSQKYKVVEIE